MNKAGLGVVMARVYVSSTTIDLQPERQAVLDWLRLARHQVCCGCWPAARLNRSRWPCCCSPAPGSPDDSGLR